MSACKVIEFYSKSDFIKVYKYVSDLYSKLSSNKNQQKTNSIDIIQAITNAISGEHFMFSTKPVLDGGKLAQNAKVHNSKLRESLIQLSIDIYKMLDKLNSTSEKVDMAIIKDSLEKLQYLTNLEGEEGKQYPFLFREPFIIVQDAVEEDLEGNETFFKFKLKYFPNDLGSQKYLEDKFTSDILRICYINLEDKTRVVTAEDLHYNILQFKMKAFKLLVEDLGLNAEDMGEFYHDSGVVNTNVPIVLNKAKLLLDNLIEDYQISFTDTNSSIKTSDKRVAYNYMVLSYFDSLLLDLVGDDISFPKGLKGIETDANTLKYSFGVDRSHLRKSWSDNEDRTAELNTSKILKKLIASIPLIHNGVSLDKKMSFFELQHTLSKLVYNVNSILKGILYNSAFTNLLLNFHNNPYNLKYALDLLFNKENKNLGDVIRLKNSLTKILDYELNDWIILESLHKFLNDVEEIEMLERSKKKQLPFSIITDILNLIHDVTPLRYSETKQQSNGSVTYEVRSPYKDKRIAGKLRLNINYSVYDYKPVVKDLTVFKLKPFKNSSDIVKEKGSLPTNLNLLGATINFIHSDLSFNIRIDGNGEPIVKQKEDIAITTNSNFFTEIYNVFGDPSQKDNMKLGIDLSDRGIQQAILSLNTKSTEKLQELPADIQHKIKVFYDALSIVDSRLGTSFLTDLDGLNKFKYFFQESIKQKDYDYFVNNLLLYSIKYLTIYQLYKNYLGTNTEDTTLLFYDWLVQNHLALKNLHTGVNDEVIQGVKFFKIIPDSTQWCDLYLQAYARVYGDLYSSVSKNLDGDNDANYSTPFLASNIQNSLATALKVHNEHNSQVQELRKLVTELLKGEGKTEEEIALYLNTMPVKPKPATSPLLFTEHPEYIKDQVIDLDARTRENSVKKVRKFTPSALLYHSIVHKFYAHAFDTNGFMTVLPATYSDKPKHVNYQISKEGSINGHSLLYIKMTKPQLMEKFRQTIGESVKLTRDNVIYTYLQLFNDFTLTADDISKKLKLYNSIEELLDEALSKGIFLTDQLYYRIKEALSKKVIVLNESLFHLAKILSDANELSKVFHILEIRFINDLIETGVNFYVDFHDSTQYENTKPKSFAELITSSTSAVARMLESYGDTMRDKDNNESLDDWLNTYAKTWVKNGKLIFGRKIQNGISIPITSPITDLNEEIELNPLFEKYFYIENLLSNNLRVSLTGHEFVHPDKSPIKDEWKSISAPLTSNHLLSNYDNIQKFLNVPIIKLSAEIINNDDITNYHNTVIWNPGNNLTDLNILALLAYIELGKTILVPNNLVIPELFAKQVFDTTLVTEENVSVTDMEGLTLLDVLAIRNGMDFYELSKNINPRISEVVNNAINIITNMSLVALTKRNVTIVGSMHYITLTLEGTSTKVKVAYIDDVTADVYGFAGESKKGLEAHDGSVFTTKVLSILENNSLASLSVAEDKKPLWHAYSHDTATDITIKCASFAIGNQEIRDSKHSSISFKRMYKKMTNLQWLSLNEDGSINKDDPNYDLYDLATTYTFKSTDNTRKHSLKFLNFKSASNAYYYTYENGKKVYYKISDFGKDELGNYYTIVKKTNSNGLVTEFLDVKVYHYFDAQGNHYTEYKPGLHTINSLYELWQAFGGENSMSKVNSRLQLSEISQEIVAEFTNTIISHKPGFRRDLNPENYIQPLKQAQIGYLINKTGAKNGAVNVNSLDAYFNDKDLRFVEVEIKGLGIQLDADHDVEIGALMTEPSQVITALEAGGYMHEEARAVFRLLKRVVEVSSKTELDVVTRFLADLPQAQTLSEEEQLKYKETKNKLYSIVAKIVLKELSTKTTATSLTEPLMRMIEKEFNKNLDHYLDEFMIPFSDNNIHSLIIPAIASLFNRKAIKRKFSGTGAVMIPSYGIIQYFEIDGLHALYDDILKDAEAYYKNHTFERNPNISYEEDIIENWLNLKQQLQTIDPDLTRFIPTDNVLIHITSVLEDGTETSNKYEVSLLSLKNYYTFKDLDKSSNKKEVLLQLGINVEGEISKMGFSKNIRKPKDLAPARIYWKFKNAKGEEKWRNVFDLAPFREAYQNPTKVNRLKVKEAFILLDQGKFVDYDGNTYTIEEMHNKPAELITSNIYSDQFLTGNNSLYSIIKRGPLAFTKFYHPLPVANYDVAFTKRNGDHTLITFTRPNNTEADYIAWSEKDKYIEKSEDGDFYDVYYIDENFRKLFKIGRYIKTDKYAINNEGKYVDAQTADIVPSKIAKRLNKDASGQIYYYTEFVSKYKLTYTLHAFGKSTIQSYTKYYINLDAIKDTLIFNEDIAKSTLLQILRAFVSNILDGIYGTDAYEDLMFPPKVTNGQALNIKNYVCKMKTVDSTFKTMVLNKIENYLNSGVLTNPPADAKGHLKWYYELIGPLQSTEEVNNNSFEGLIMDGASLLNIYDTYYLKKAEEIYTSFLLALYFTSARIPAQTLLSFMLMLNVAFTNTTRNVAYVSVWQTWLQGSDYDIDKAYLIGLEFASNGKLIAFSNLINYSNIDLLKASLKLPPPIGITVSSSIFGNINKLLESSPAADTLVIDLTLYIISTNTTEFINANNPSPLDYIKLAKLLRYIYNEFEKGLYSGIHLIGADKNSSADIKLAFLSLSRAIRLHENTVTSPLLEEASYKNFISNSVMNIVQDLKNMVLAYSPITLRDLLKEASKSKSGKLALIMNYMNPNTKYLLQYENMIGKDVIGIMATAEKVFFNLCQYWNEGVRSNDDAYIENLLFSKTFSRISGRNEGNPKSKTITRLANVNFHNFENIQNKFTSHSLIIDYFKNKYDEAIWESEYEKFILLWMNQDNLNDVERQLFLDVTKEINTTLDTFDDIDLFISQLLSAATDNAKELILKKINCSSNMAKNYVYLLLMGFDIKDIVSFMTSPAVLTITELLESNIFDGYIPQMFPKEYIGLASGNINLYKFKLSTIKTDLVKILTLQIFNEDNIPYMDIYKELTGYTEKETKPATSELIDNLLSDDEENSETYDEVVVDDATDTSEEKQETEEAAEKENDEDVLDPKVKEFNKVKKHFKSLKALEQLALYIKLKALGIIKSSLYTPNPTQKFNHKYEINKMLGVISDYADNIASKMHNAFKLYNTTSDTNVKSLSEGMLKYFQDIEEFKRINEYANEISALGNTFLKSNLGIPTGKSEFVTFLGKIKKALTDRQDAMGIKASRFDFTWLEKKVTDTKKLNLSKKRFKDAFESSVFMIIANNDFLKNSLSEEGKIEYVKNLIKKAYAFGIIDTFNVEYWLSDKVLTKEDFNSSRKFLDEELVYENLITEPIAYRLLVSEYYNAIKGTFNIFDVVAKSHLYSANFELVNAVLIMQKYVSTRAYLTDKIYLELQDRNTFMTDSDINKISSYANHLIITSFFTTVPDFLWHIKQDEYTLSNSYKDILSIVPHSIDMTTSIGRAKFKKSFESFMMKLKNGDLSDLTNLTEDQQEQLKNNKFVRNLYVNRLNGIPYLTVDLSLDNVLKSDVASSKYKSYLDGLNELVDIEYNGHSIVDWLMLYNLYVTQNQPGADRLTGLFRGLMGDTNRVLYKYYKYTGSTDSKFVDSKILETLNYDLDEILLLMAPTVNKFNERGALSKFIKLYHPNKGYIYKLKTKDGYIEISTFPGLWGFKHSAGVSAQLQLNYLEYLMFPRKTEDLIEPIREGLISNLKEDLIMALSNIIRYNLLSVEIKCD